MLLRPLTPADATAFVAHEPEHEEEIRSRLERRPTLERDGVLTLGVEIDGALLGDIQARAPKHGFPPGVCELGVTLFPEARGRGVGREAVERFTELLFAEHGMARVQATTAVDNVAMRRVLERLGWELEGILRDYFPGEEGGRVDYAMYAITKRR